MSFIHSTKPSTVYLTVSLSDVELHNQCVWKWWRSFCSCLIQWFSLFCMRGFCCWHVQCGGNLVICIFSLSYILENIFYRHVLESLLNFLSSHILDECLCHRGSVSSRDHAEFICTMDYRCIEILVLTWQLICLLVLYSHIRVFITSSLSLSRETVNRCKLFLTEGKWMFFIISYVWGLGCGKWNCVTVIWWQLLLMRPLTRMVDGRSWTCEPQLFVVETWRNKRLPQ